MATVPGTDIEKPDVTLTDGDGNSFAIMGRVKKALKEAGVPQDVIGEYFEEATSGNYDHLLATTMKYANVG